MGVIYDKSNQNNNSLLGVAVWRLGLEDENYWISIKDKLNK